MYKIQKNANAIDRLVKPNQIWRYTLLKINKTYINELVRRDCRKINIVTK